MSSPSWEHHILNYKSIVCEIAANNNSVCLFLIANEFKSFLIYFPCLLYLLCFKFVCKIWTIKRKHLFKDYLSIWKSESHADWSKSCKILGLLHGCRVSSAACQGTWAGRQIGLKAIPIWDASTRSGSLMHNATILTPKVSA